MNSEEYKSLSHLHPDLISEIREYSLVKEFLKDTQILREGQYVKVIPIVLEGLIRVSTSYDDKELLLYYIKPDESCIMSFAASLKNEPSKIIAIVEEPSRVLLIPTGKLPKWLREYPEINTLFYQQYNLRYSELLDTINHLIFDKLDKRLHDYLVEKKALTNSNPLKISHRQIANDLGTVREVISRTMKKLESEGKVKQHTSSIEILTGD